MPEPKFGLTIFGNMQAVGELASRVEALGYDSIWTGEHVVWRTPTHDGLMAMAAAAAVTKRVRVGTSITLLPLKHPVLMCKAVTTLDHISNGRASMGVGIGGEYAKEFEATGNSVKVRGPKTDESLELMKRLWTEDGVSFHGRFFSFDDVTLEPKPVQKPHPPILVAGRRGSLRRTARFGNGWMPYMYSPEMFREDWKQIEEMAGEYGRNPGDIERTFFGFITVGDDYERALKTAAESLGGRYGQDFTKIVSRYAIFGTPQQCAERLQQYIESGAEHLILSPNAPIAQSAHFPETIANEIIPLLKR